jgi:hypothetical protein
MPRSQTPVELERLAFTPIDMLLSTIMTVSASNHMDYFGALSLHLRCSLLHPLHWLHLIRRLLTCSARFYADSYSLRRSDLHRLAITRLPWRSIISPSFIRYTNFYVSISFLARFFFLLNKSSLIDGISKYNC